MQFVDYCRTSKVRSLALFGDSITVGAGASGPEASWAGLVSGEVGARLTNAAISGTVLQSSPDAQGHPRPGNGYERYREALLGDERADALVILYGYNDARYTAAPQTFGVGGFLRDYHAMVKGLIDGGFDANAICVGSPPFIPTKGFSIGSAGFTGQTRAGFVAFVEAVQEVAKSYGTFYAPVYESMVLHGDGELASLDTTHPNDAGHRTIARAVLSAGKF